MDLVYMDQEYKDQGIIQNCTLDYEASTNPNDCTFQIKTTIAGNPLLKGDYIHVEGEEYGGRIDSIQVDTAKKIIIAEGRSWRGILASKILIPPAGSAYKIVSGNVGKIIQDLIDEAGIGDIFEAVPTKITINKYQFYRYIDLYSGLIKMCGSKGLKLKIYWDHTKIKVEAIERTEYTKKNSITSDLFDFKIKTATSINHMIGLGSGELEDRQVVHKYLDADGNVSDEQVFTGISEYTQVYENSGVESIEDLAEQTEDALKKNKQSDQLEITSYDLNCDIGDKIEASDAITGISILRYVTDKILTIEDHITKIQYKVGASI